ncbi:hypothetical protein FOZ60_007274 [Perkinsus olseni]|uniref:Uncharacterized protein n=1 Tax=Perkinsus olseni TaxID=32597 RepID=A0A7J6NLU9_PEROL|nr:hypothetical protein FOZ60_007274 [Perkinsus olseni]
MCLDMQVGVGIIDDNGVLTVFNDDGGRIVLLVTFNRRNRNRMSSRSLAVLNEEPRNLQVVAVVSAKSVYKLPYAYFRHGGQWQGWWFAKPYEHPHECSISLDDISDSILQYDICLFTVIPDVPSNEYNRSLMEVVGGQNVVYCAEHRVLLGSIETYS